MSLALRNLALYVTAAGGAVTVTTTKSDLALGNTSATINSAVTVTTTKSDLALGNTSATMGVSYTVTTTKTDLALGNTSATIASNVTVTTTKSDLALGNTSAAMGISFTVATTTSTLAMGAIPWTPNSLSGVRAFWMADDIAGIDTDPVSSWVDRVNAYDLVQSDAAKRPTLQTAELNGHSTVRFDGSNDFLEIVSVLGITAQPFTQFAVWKLSATNQALMQWTNDRGGVYSIAGSKINLHNGTSLNSNAQFTTGAFHLSSTISSGASSSHAIDGNTRNTGNSGTGVPTGTVRVGSERTGTGYFLNGDIPCIIVLDAAISQDDEDRLNGWAAHTFGLTANLPSGHPYKSTPPTISGVDTVATVSASSTVATTKSDLALGNTSATITSATIITATTSDLALGGNAANMAVSELVTTTKSDMALGNTSATLAGGAAVATTASTLSLGNTTASISAAGTVTTTTSTLTLGNSAATMDATGGATADEATVQGHV